MTIDYTAIIVATITGTLAGVSPVILVYLKDYIIPKKTKQILTSDKSQIYTELDRLANVVRMMMKAHSCYIAYFHNGGHFINGASMDKYSVVGEDYISSLRSIKPVGTNVMVTAFPYTFHELVIKNQSEINCVVDVNHSDRSYIEMLQGRGIQAVINYAIRNNTTNALIGFISIEYNNIQPIENIERDNIWKYCNKAAKCLNDLKRN